LRIGGHATADARCSPHLTRLDRPSSIGHPTLNQPNSERALREESQIDRGKVRDLAVVDSAERAVMLEMHLAVFADVHQDKPANREVAEPVVQIPLRRQVPMCAFMQEQMKICDPISRPNGRERRQQ
jgi:hypothetical protein